MKHAFLILITVLVVHGCKKSNSIKHLKTTFAGKWEYERYSGYPFTNTYSPPGNGQYIILGTNGSFERRLHDSLIFKGTYSLEEKPDCYPAASTTYFSTNESNYSTEGYIALDSNKLTITTFIRTKL